MPFWFRLRFFCLNIGIILLFPLLIAVEHLWLYAVTTVIFGIFIVFSDYLSRPCKTAIFCALRPDIGITFYFPFGRRRAAFNEISVYSVIPPHIAHDETSVRNIRNRYKVVGSEIVFYVERETRPICVPRSNMTDGAWKETMECLKKIPLEPKKLPYRNMAKLFFYISIIGWFVSVSLACKAL